MTHGQDIVENLPDEGAHSRCLQAAFSEGAESLAVKGLGAKKGRGSRKGRDVKHQLESDV